MKEEEKEMCSICGRSVKFGSGYFVNRIPDFNTCEEREEIGRAYPEGGFICAICEEVK